MLPSYARWHLDHQVIARVCAGHSHKLPRQIAQVPSIDQPHSSGIKLHCLTESCACIVDIFDPADFLGNARQKADVKRWRESEITHGRVAMLAALGFITQEQIIDFPNLPFPHVEGESHVSTGEFSKDILQGVCAQSIKNLPRDSFQQMKINPDRRNFIRQTYLSHKHQK